MQSMVNFLFANWMYVGLAILLLLIMLCLISGSLRGQLKKGGILLLIFAGLGVGYYFVTGKSPSGIPGEINRYFSDPQLQEEESHRYYKDPSKRYGDQLQ